MWKLAQSNVNMAWGWAQVIGSNNTDSQR